MSARGQFSSRFGFILAAAGSAVGLGNIWSFPTQVATNGGAAFVVVYLLLTFVLAYPALMAELTIGRYAESNVVGALDKISSNPFSKLMGRMTGYWSMIAASLILSFYAIIAGWMLAHALQMITDIIGWHNASEWLITSSLTRNIIFCLLFSLLSATIVCRGVSDGIEKWSSRLMPLLLILIVLLVLYVSTLDGAAEGWKVYLVPDFSKVLSPDLLLSAMGQAFFSLSLGVGTMLIYGSYISKKENLVVLGGSVALVDVGIAILAGMLIIPAMYVALHNGVTIFTETGELIDGDRLVFLVIPELFKTMGEIGHYVGLVFFILMSVAALTSSISMLEVPVSYTVENSKMSRNKVTWVIASLIMCMSTVIIFNLDTLFGFVVSLSTVYSQPLLGMLMCIFLGWVWSRNSVLKELKQGNEEIESSFFWKIWPTYVRFVCPTTIAVMFYQSQFS